MDAVLRAVAIYAFLLVLFRVSGKRSLGEITTFDFVLLLVIAEATQQGLLGDDFSVTRAFLVVATLFAVDNALSFAAAYVRPIEKVLEGAPLVLVDDGKLLEDRMRKERVDEEDILAAARQSQGLARLDQIQYAVLERNGGISVVPKGSA